MSKIKHSDIDFYFEYLHEDDSNDMAETKSSFKPEEVAGLKKSHDYWENARLKAWSERFKESKRKRSTESFEYLL